jgi:hypothetical protein
VAEVVFQHPHETRIFALQVAVEFVNGGGRKNAVWTTPEVLQIAREFEEYLTGKPVEGYAADATPASLT